MKKALLFMGLLCSCIAAKAQDLPSISSISSATYGTSAPVTVEVALPHTVLTLRLYTPVSLAGATVSVRLADIHGSHGPAFAASPL